MFVTFSFTLSQLRKTIIAQLDNCRKAFSVFCWSWVWCNTGTPWEKDDHPLKKFNTTQQKLFSTNLDRQAENSAIEQQFKSTIFGSFRQSIYPAGARTPNIRT